MIEQGLAKLVQGDAGVAAVAAHGGGFLRTLPKGQPLPSWTYQFVSAPPDITLTTVVGLVFARVQIDCFGNAAPEVVNLAKAISLVLHGYRGTLPDDDATVVDSIFRMDLHDPEFDPASRTWRRVLEFQVNYKSQY